MEKNQTLNDILNLKNDWNMNSIYQMKGIYDKNLNPAKHPHSAVRQYPLLHPSALWGLYYITYTENETGSYSEI